MARLKSYHKEYIVTQLACYQSPTTIQDMLNEQFGLDIPLNQIAYYNPENAQGGRELANKWRDLHSKTRDKFIEGAIDIPITHKTYRLQELQDNYSKLKEIGNLIAANAVLEQAAKEVNGAYDDIRGMLKENTHHASLTIYQQLNQKFTQINNQSNNNVSASTLKS